MDNSFIGWIPCVSGKLFFDYSSCGLKKVFTNTLLDINHSELNSKHELNQFILISSQVNWKDYGPDSQTGDYQVFLIAKRSYFSEDLEGSIYIINENKYESIREITHKEAKKINTKLKFTNSNSDVTISEDYYALQSTLESAELTQKYKIDFKINSFGFVKIFNESDEYNHLLFRQAYYYIKFSFHKHKHHHESSESLTTIHSIDESLEDSGLVLIHDLKRSLVEMGRDFLPTQFKLISQSQGIVTYAKSLARSCYNMGYIKEETFKSEMSYLDNLDRSLSISADKISKTITLESMVSGNARAIILFILAMITPLVLIFKEQVVVVQNSYILKGLNYIFFNDLSIAFSFGLLLAFYKSYVFIGNKFGSASLAYELLFKVIHYFAFNDSIAQKVLLNLLVPLLIISFFLIGINMLFNINI